MIHPNEGLFNFAPRRSNNHGDRRPTQGCGPKSSSGPDRHKTVIRSGQESTHPKRVFLASLINCASHHGKEEVTGSIMIK